MRVLKEVRQFFRNYHLKSGIFHFYRGEHGPAAEYLTRVITDDSEVSLSDRRAAVYFLVQTRIGAASALESKGEFDRAMEQYNLALQVMPTYPDVHFQRGQLLVRLGHLEEAVASFRRALETNPDYVDARLRLGYVQLALGEAAAARETFRAAMDSDQRARQRRLAAGLEALDQGQIETARQLFLDAFREEMGSFRHHFNEGLLHLRNEEYADAVRELQEAAALCPRFADVQNFLGIAQAEMGALDEAIDSFRRSVSINPELIVAWLNLAYAAYAAEDFEESREAVDRVLEREPDNAPALQLAEKLPKKARKRPPLQGAAG